MDTNAWPIHDTNGVGVAPDHRAQTGSAGERTVGCSRGVAAERAVQAGVARADSPRAAVDALLKLMWYALEGIEVALLLALGHLVFATCPATAPDQTPLLLPIKLLLDVLAQQPPVHLFCKLTESREQRALAGRNINANVVIRIQEAYLIAVRLTVPFLARHLPVPEHRRCIGRLP